MATVLPAQGILRQGAGALDRRIALWSLALSIAYAAVVIGFSSTTSFYTLDDPYIHMALAENIARGHFGVNLEDVSNPSSSILWPFLMAAFERVGLMLWAPLVINIASFALTLRLLTAFTLGRLAPAGQNPTNALIFAGLAFFSFNLFGIIYTGMEHSLHVLVSVAAMIRVIDRRYDRTALACLLLSPLLRFEGAAILALGVAMALVDRRHAFAALAAGIAVLALAAYVGMLHALGLPMLPSSVLTKSSVSSSMVDGGSMLAPALRNFLANLRSPYGPMFGAFAASFAAAALPSRGRDRVIALGGVVLALAALAFGRMDSYSRYEPYFLCVLGVTFFHLYQATLQKLLQKRMIAIVLGCGLVLLNSPGGLWITFTMPMAARNIDRQQYQLHRLVADCWQAPIAVNDLGWTSFRNDRYVLDLAGLGDESARRARAANAPNWVERIVADRHVEAAAIYPNWFLTVPTSWVHVGDLVLDDQRITPYGSLVGVYASRSEAAPRLRACLARLADSLPAGASVQIAAAPL